jgi:hypothetical protein
MRDHQLYKSVHVKCKEFAWRETLVPFNNAFSVSPYLGSKGIKVGVGLYA